MQKKVGYYILSKGSALKGYEFVHYADLRSDGKLHYTLVEEIEEATWYKKEFVETIVALDKDIKIQKIVLKDVEPWK